MLPPMPDHVITLAKAVEAAGGRALLVGGTVRDILLGHVPKDADVEVFGLAPERLMEVVALTHPDRMGIAGSRFTVLKARYGPHEVDLSVPRRRLDGRTADGDFFADAAPDMPLEDAARRRDFTMNAIALDPLTGQRSDFFGGERDIQTKVLRVTDAGMFGQDPLRVLRGVQLAARFGLKMDPESQAVCRGVVGTPAFAELPSARVGEEWRKLLLLAERPSVGLELGLAVGAWHVLHPALVDLIGCPQDAEWHPEGEVWTHNNMVVDAAAAIVRREGLTGNDALVIMLAALCHDLGKPSTTEFVDGRWRSRGHDKAGVPLTYEFLARMEFGAPVNHKAAHLVADHLFPAINGETASDAAVRRLSRRLDPATVRELILVAEADHRGRTVPWDGFPSAAALLEHADRLTVTTSQPKRLLNGRDLIERLGWEPSPDFGRVLAAVEEAQIEGEVTDLEEALALARRLR